MKQLFILLFFTGLWACNDNGSSAASATVNSLDVTAYSLENLQGSEVQEATKRDDKGFLAELGYLKNGKRTGTWVTYYPGTLSPKTITGYMDGALNGIFMEFNDRGQVNSMVTYKDNVYHGPFGRYKFNRPLEEGNYKNNKLDGVRKIYFENTGKIQAETEYKDGVQHGTHRNYNESGQVILEYEYKDGEKVSGQTFTPSASEK